MSSLKPGALDAAAALAATTATAFDLSPKHQSSVHITPLSIISPSQSPSAAATHPASSPTRSRPASGSNNDDDAASRPGSINSQTLAWDQAVLRIEYLVSTMTTPSPYSPILSPLDNTSQKNLNPHRSLSPLAGGGGYHITPTSPPATPTDHPKADDMRSANSDQGAEALPATKGWPSVPRDKVRRKVLQIDTWRVEVAGYGTAAFCACSSPAPFLVPTSDGPTGLGSDNSRFSSSTPQEGSFPASPAGTLSSSPGVGGGPPPPIAIPPTAITCGFCGRHPSPTVVLRSPSAAAGMKKAFVEGFKGLLGRRSGSRKGREKDREKDKVMDASGSERDKATARAPEDGSVLASPVIAGRQAPVADPDNLDLGSRTAMYRVDMPPSQSQPQPGSHSQRDFQSPDGNSRGAVGRDSGEGDEEVDLDDLSQSTNPRGLLQSNDRLKRAEKLLARGRGRGGGAKALGAGLESSSKTAPVGDGTGGGSTGFGLSWGKTNGGDRSRKGFGKLQ